MSRIKSFTCVLLVVVSVIAGAIPASAHTGFQSSSPANGDVVDEPVHEITLTFSGEATPAGEGFVVLDPTGTLREPDEITSVDNLAWTLRFDEPLAGGDVGVRWTVAAPDAHPIEGSFSFTVTAPVPAEEAEVEQPAPDAQIESSASATEELPDAADTPATESTPVDEPFEAVPAHTDSVDNVESTIATSNAEPVDLESFLETANATPVAVDVVASAARILSVLGALCVIGGAAFAAFALRGDPTDIRAVLTWVRRGGAIVVAGAIAEAATNTVTLSGQWSALASFDDLRNALWSSAGLAISLRATGGFMAASKTTITTTTTSAVGDRLLAARRLAPVGGGHDALLPDDGPDEPFVYPDDHKWDPRPALAGIAGAALIAASFMFDGHTASEGPRWLHALANVIHVTAAAVWAGGIMMLAFTIHRRRRDNRPMQALQLAVRFSVMATAALIAAGIAGIALSAIVIDSVSDLWSTPWGRLLALKFAVVAVAAAGGAYNHRIIVPSLDRNPDDQVTINRFRTVVGLEAAALVTAGIITAFLIAAASSA